VLSLAADFAFVLALVILFGVVHFGRFAFACRRRSAIEAIHGHRYALSHDHGDGIGDQREVSARCVGVKFARDSRGVKMRGSGCGLVSSNGGSERAA